MVRVSGRTVVPVLFFYISACSKKKKKPKSFILGEKMKIHSEEKGKDTGVRVLCLSSNSNFPSQLRSMLM